MIARVNAFSSSFSFPYSFFSSLLFSSLLFSSLLFSSLLFSSLLFSSLLLLSFFVFPLALSHLRHIGSSTPETKNFPGEIFGFDLLFKFSILVDGKKRKGKMNKMKNTIVLF